ncbi:MAG TPA: cytochrome b/b6 domain-containing protein [Anaerolineales bacterium]|nr:cytochrome b/b6 domain-containing protein [Anaerolineales bacterium]
MSTDSVTVNPSLEATASPVAVKPKRYHPALIALHWLIALMIFAAFFLAHGNEGERERFRPGQGNFPQQGFQQGDFPRNSQPGNPPGQGFPQGGFPPQAGRQSIFSTIGWHMIVGIAVLVLLALRLLVRWVTKRPAWASTGNKLFDWVGELTHFGLYLLTFAMVITGIILADQRGILARTFGIGSTPTPGSFRRGGFSLGFFHGGVWTLLILLIALHVGATLYHQFILKDNLLGRMWFGRQTE